MKLVWEEFRGAVPLVFHGNPYLGSIIWFTVEVAVLATVIAAVVGLPIGLAIGLGRFRGRRLLHVLANAGLAVPPVLVGLLLYLLFVPTGVFGSLHLVLTRRSVFIAQTILAIPYVVALSAAAILGLPPGLLDQARAFGASRVQLSVLALREARIGVIAAVIAALGSTLSEVGAMVVVGGNLYGYDQTLAGAALFEGNAQHYQDAIAIGYVLMVLIFTMMCALGLLQQRGGGIRMRFRPAR